MEQPCFSGPALIATAALAFAAERFGDEMVQKVREAIGGDNHDDIDIEKEILWSRITNWAHFARYSVVFLVGLTTLESFVQLALLGAPQPAQTGGYVALFLALELGLRFNSALNSLLAFAAGGAAASRTLFNVVAYFALLAAAFRGDGTPCFVLGLFVLISRFHLQATNIVVVTELNAMLDMSIVDVVLDGYAVALTLRALWASFDQVHVAALVFIGASVARDSINLAKRAQAFAAPSRDHSD